MLTFCLALFVAELLFRPVPGPRWPPAKSRIDFAKRLVIVRQPLLWSTLSDGRDLIWMSNNDGLHGDDDLAMLSPFKSVSRIPEQGRSRRIPKNRAETHLGQSNSTSEDDNSLRRLGGEEEEDAASTPRGTQGCVGVLQSFLVIFGVLQTDDPTDEKVSHSVLRENSADTMTMFDNINEGEEDEDAGREDLFRKLGFKDVRKP